MVSKVTFQMPNFSNMFEKAIDETVQEVGHEVENVAKENAPVATGYYKDNIAFDGKDQIVASANYSSPIEYGIQNPVLITPKSAKVLHFVNKEGQDVFVKWAQQKARNPNPVMRNAARQVQQEVDRIFKENLGKD